MQTRALIARPTDRLFGAWLRHAARQTASRTKSSATVAHDLNKNTPLGVIHRPHRRWLTD